MALFKKNATTTVPPNDHLGMPSVRGIAKTGVNQPSLKTPRDTT